MKIQSLLAVLLIAPLPVLGYETVTGTITSNTTFAANTTYHVTGTITVQSGVTLTISQGTVLKFSSPGCGGYNGIDVNGAISVAGSAGSRATFTHASDDSVGEIVPHSSGCREIRVKLVPRNDESSTISQAEFRQVGLDIGSARATLDSINFSNYGNPFRGDLSPRGSFRNITFGSGAGYAGYYATRFIARAGDRIPAMSGADGNAVPYLVDNGEFRIGQGASLSVDAGAVIRTRTTITVSSGGTLSVNGTPAQRAVITDFNDSRYGGDHQGSGTFQYSPLTIKFEPGSVGNIRSLRLVMRSTSDEVLRVDGANPVFNDLVIDSTSRSISGTYPLIYISGQGEPQFQCVDFVGSNLYVGFQNANAASVAPIQFVDGYWGSPDGPTTDVQISRTTGRVQTVGAITNVPFRASRNDSCTSAITQLLDIDGNGAVDPLVDGVLLGRYLNGLRGSDLNDGVALPSNAGRQSARDLETYLDRVRSGSLR